MSHLRTQIRNAVAAKLLGLATTGANAFTMRLYPLPASALPALVIRSGSESIEETSIGTPPVLARGYSFFVECIVRGESGHEEALDQMALEVEQALAADRTLGGLVKNFYPLSIPAPEFDAEGDLPVARLALPYLAEYRALEGAPQTAI